MAGIGFQLNRLAREGGLGGSVAAGIVGVAVSSGPWLCTAGGVAAFQALFRERLSHADMMSLQILLVYVFALSAMIAATVGMIVTRLVADAIFLDQMRRIPSLLFAALASVSALAALIGALVLGGLSDLPPMVVVLGITSLVLLSQMWVLSLFVTAVQRFGGILAAYALGIGVSVPVAWMVSGGGGLIGPAFSLTVCLAVITGSLLVVVRRDFPGPALWPADWIGTVWREYHVTLAGIFATAALWVDKWVMWFAPGSIAASGHLRFHPLHDSATYLGLLSLIPGLALILIMVETRFDRAFSALVTLCTGRATLGRIEEARRDVVAAIGDGLRILLVGQGILAFVLWVTAPAIMSTIGADPRAIIGFRYVIVGNLFHLLTLFATMILSYYDLNGRVLLAWAGFFAGSLIGTLMIADMGFAGLGWGYLVGAVSGAIIALAGVVMANRELLYLLFVGNNPAIAGAARRWA